LEKVSFENHKQILSRTNTRNAERKFQGANGLGSEKSSYRLKEAHKPNWKFLLFGTHISMSWYA